MKNTTSLLKTNQGSTVVTFTLFLTILCGVSALVIDIGLISLEQSKVANAVDAAALATASELIKDSDHAASAGFEYLRKNGVDPLQAQIEISEDKTEVTVTAEEDVPLHFAKIFGLHSMNVKKLAKAKFGFPTSVTSGIRPFAIEQQELEFNKTYILKNGGGAGYDGNYGGIALGDTGAQAYLNNIVSGFKSELKIGDQVYTEPGNISGPTEEGITTLVDNCVHNCTSSNFNINCERVVTILVVDSLLVNGRSKATIVGFASFLIEDVAGTGNNSIVTGSFVKNIVTGDMSSTGTDYGLRTIKLVE